MTVLTFRITIHLEPKYKISYLLSTFLANELLPTKSSAVAGSLINLKISIKDNNFY